MTVCYFTSYYPHAYFANSANLRNVTDLLCVCDARKPEIATQTYNCLKKFENDYPFAKCQAPLAGRR